MYSLSIYIKFNYLIQFYSDLEFRNVRILKRVSQYCPVYPEGQIQRVDVHTPPFLHGFKLQSNINTVIFVD